MLSLQIVFPSLEQLKNIIAKFRQEKKLKVNKRNLQYWNRCFSAYSYINTFYWQKNTS